MRHSQWIACVAFSPDGQLLASTGGDQKLNVWTVPTGRQLLSIDTGFSHPRAVCFSQDGRSIAVTQEDRRRGEKSGRVRVYRGASSPAH